MKIELRLSINALTTLLAVNIIFFLLGILIQLISPTNSQSFVLIGGLDTLEVLRGSFWLSITSAFLHLDPLHFILNMYALYRIGSIVYTFFNGKVLFLTYIIGVLAGSLLTLLSTVLFLSTPFSLGASGAIFALIGLLFISTFRKKRYGSSLPFSYTDFLPIILLSLWIGILPGSRINNWAHLGGFLSGIILGLFVGHSFNNIKTSLENLLEKILYYISLFIFITCIFAFIFNFIYLIFFL